LTLNPLFNTLCLLRSIPKKALAAIGQGRLIALWDNLFGQLEQPIAQVLLTRGDISDVSFFLLYLPRSRYLNEFQAHKIFERGEYAQEATFDGCCTHSQ